MRIILLILALPLLMGAADRAVLDVGAVPHVAEAGRGHYRDFLLMATPRSFAVGPGGGSGWASGWDTTDETDARALEICGDPACRVYARDLAVVWRGPAPPPAPEAPVLSGRAWALVPDARFLQQGARAARGAYVWAHGRSAGEDSRGGQPQPHVRAFNNAGWDVLRLDREPWADEAEDAALWLRVSARWLRLDGYRRVVAGGQSRGGWTALQALAEPGLVDGVVAVAPAAHGLPDSPARRWAVSDFDAVLAAARSPRARVAVVAFAGDDYDPDPARRAAALRALAPRTGGLLLLDRPRGLAGHAGGATPLFALRYGACLLDFVERRRDACG